MVDHARRGPGNPEGVPRWTGRGPGNPEGVPRSIRLPESARAKERPGGRTIAAVGGLRGTGVMAGPAPGCPLTRDGSGDGHYQPWLIGRGNLAPAPAEVARDGALTEAVSRVRRRDGRCRRRRHAPRDRRRRGRRVGGRLPRAGRDPCPPPAPAPDLPEPR